MSLYINMVSTDYLSLMLHIKGEHFYADSNSLLGVSNLVKYSQNDLVTEIANLSFLWMSKHFVLVSGNEVIENAPRAFVAY